MASSNRGSPPSGARISLWGRFLRISAGSRKRGRSLYSRSRSGRGDSPRMPRGRTSATIAAEIRRRSAPIREAEEALSALSASRMRDADGPAARLVLVGPHERSSRPSGRVACAVRRLPPQCGAGPVRWSAPTPQCGRVLCAGRRLPPQCGAGLVRCSASTPQCGRVLCAVRRLPPQRGRGYFRPVRGKFLAPDRARRWPPHAGEPCPPRRRGRAPA
ncbi:hypothetical protein B0H15DRAFT_808490 [Mycena belliarum]|uniref:Uncharacterized protein n=1 Tax=Mycena belliarum TaxID=1033014 RepID=A0AAD6UJ77_9AGAR|nr:hypothetical protein B0H15DRAFT_808490 [Mycena belliae]